MFECLSAFAPPLAEPPAPSEGWVHHPLHVAAALRVIALALALGDTTVREHRRGRLVHLARCNTSIVLRFERGVVKCEFSELVLHRIDHHWIYGPDIILSVPAMCLSGLLEDRMKSRADRRYPIRQEEIDALRGLDACDVLAEIASPLVLYRPRSG